MEMDSIESETLENEYNELLYGLDNGLFSWNLGRFYGMQNATF